MTIGDPSRLFILCSPIQSLMCDVCHSFYHPLEVWDLIWLCTIDNRIIVHVRVSDPDRAGGSGSGSRGAKMQSWAHRSYKLSERSKAMSDLWFSEWKKMSVERWANCQKKEFAHRSKRSLNLKERAFWAVRSLSDVPVLSLTHIPLLETGYTAH